MKILWSTLAVHAADLKPVASCAECGEEFTPGSLMLGPLVSTTGTHPASDQ
jgi:hypothetical protein